MVKISMDTFVSRFQRERYDDWMNGCDFGPHPEDPLSMIPPALIKKEEIAIKKEESAVKKEELTIKEEEIDPPMAEL